MSWFIYMLECEDGSLYTGIAIDVAKRFLQHCSGKGARYTKAHVPKQILFSVMLPDRSSALRIELAVKTLSAKQKRELASRLLDMGEPVVQLPPANKNSIIKTIT